MKDYRKESIRFVLKTEINLGESAALNLAMKLQECFYHRIGVVVDEGLFNGNDYVRQIVAKLEREMKFVQFYLNTMPEPTYDHLDKAKMAFADEQLDCIVGVGGGSTIDLAKGIATLLTNEGPALQYRGFGGGGRGGGDGEPRRVHQADADRYVPSSGARGSRDHRQRHEGG